MPHSSNSPILVWIRQDLRLRDHPALHAACESGRSVIFLYIMPEKQMSWYPGAATRWWLHHSLLSFQKQLDKWNQKLVIRQGAPQKVIQEIIQAYNIDTVFWNRRYDPADREIDEEVKSSLKKQGLDATSFPGSLLIEPWKLLTQNGDPYQVFTPYWKASLKRGEFAQPLPVPRKIPTPPEWPESLTVEDLNLLPKIDWDSDFYQHWEPGEPGAQKQWESFLSKSAENYKTDRDIPSVSGTSRLSPHLHFGEITPRQIYWDAQQEMKNRSEQNNAGLDCYVREIGWRDFSYHVLFHFPQTAENPLRETFADFPWENHADWLKAWQKGKTGFPIIDAGMRELWKTGWMHNRVRMIVASFLTKDLLIHWREGADWFWDTLVDADLANNTMGWQWASGCGADAAPYFRIFNPLLQSKKFDPDGTYIRKWCPELGNLPDKWIHEPGNAPPKVLEEAGVILGETYPEPIVDHAERRKLALEHWETVKS